MTDGSMENSDPRDIGGDIAGPGGPFDRDSVVIDSRRALFPDFISVATFERELTRTLAQPLLALVVEGRISGTQDRARLMIALNTDGAAAIVSEIVAAAGRDIDMRRDTGDVAEGFGAQFRVALDDRMEKLRQLRGER